MQEVVKYCTCSSEGCELHVKNTTKNELLYQHWTIYLGISIQSEILK